MDDIARGGRGSGTSRRGLLAALSAGPLLAGAACAGRPVAGPSSHHAASSRDDGRGHAPQGGLAPGGTAALLLDHDSGEDGGGGAGPGRVVGTAVCVADGLVACAAHSLPRGTRHAWLRPVAADGARSVRVAVAARSATSDLAFLADAARSLRPVPLADAPAERGDPVWAVGHPALGRAVASGTVEFPDAVLPGFGRGFTARLPALMGYSGGPVLGADGTLRGMVSALPEPGATGALALLAGFDLAGLARSPDAPRRVFALSAHTLAAEAARLGLA